MINILRVNQEQYKNIQKLYSELLKNMYDSEMKAYGEFWLFMLCKRLIRAKAPLS
jgi:hypothetical protein